MAMTFGTLDFAVAFNRQTAFPLDAKSYFESLELATAAAASAQEAGSSETTYYYGQTVAVVESGKATLYVIQPDNTLKEVGGNIVINENVFAKDADGSLNLLGFADAVAGAQLVKSADGGSIVGTSSNAIVSGESAYNNDGVLVSGSLAKANLSGALHANQTTTAGYDFYNVSMSIGHNRNGDVAPIQIPVYQGDWVV